MHLHLLTLMRGYVWITFSPPAPPAPSSAILHSLHQLTALVINFVNIKIGERLQRSVRHDVSPLFTRCLGYRRRREDVIDFSRRVGVSHV